MGSTHFLSPSPLYRIFITHNKTLLNPSFSSNICSSSSSSPNRRSDSGAFRSRRFEFEDEFEFEFGRRENGRNWWFDEDDDDGAEFGSWDEPSIAIDWVFKIFKAFGWMVPAIMISSYLSPLLGTGSNSLIMALVLPLGQTALSLVMDKLWGGPSSSPSFRPQARPRSKSRSRSRSRRSKRSPFTGTANPANGGAREARSRRGPVYGGYHSWGAAKKGEKGSSKFGGWDELDQDVTSNNSFANEQRQKFDAPEREYAETGKLNRMINSDKPLIIRLLIAVFPFLGSWTRFFF